MAGSISCPPLEPSSGRCWHNYGLKWVRTWVEPQEQDLYYQHFNTGIYRAAEVVREQLIDTAVDEVVSTLSQPLTPGAARRGRWALSALHGLRYSLCAVEFQECYQSEAEAADKLLTFCSVAEEMLARLNVRTPNGHSNICTALLVPEALEQVVQELLHMAQPPPAPPTEELFQFPLFFPKEFSPASLCDPETLPLRALTNGDFAFGPGWVDYRGVRVPHMSMETILKRIRRKNVQLSRWVVNLGAADGRCGRGTEVLDPANCLVEEQNFHGLLIEGNESLALATHARLGDDRLNDVLVRAAAITPSTVADLVLGQLPVNEVDLLKIDVDSIPHDALLVALLSSGLRAKVLHTEIGPWFPPPAQYWRDYGLSEPLVYTPRPEIIGLNPSLSRVDEVVKPFGYELLQVELYDAIWIRKDYLEDRKSVV